MARSDAAAESAFARMLIRDADAHTFVREGVRQVASLVDSSYGPMGLETLVETEDNAGELSFVRSASGSEILNAVDSRGGFNHPVAALLVDSVDAMHRGLRDGSTRTLLLADELIDRGLTLIEDGVDPASVVVGYSMSVQRAGQVLDALARPVSASDRETLRNVAATTMTGDISNARWRTYADLVVEAAVGLDSATRGWPDTDDIKIVTTGEARDATLHQGVVTRRELGPGSEVNLDVTDLAAAIQSPITDVTVAVVDSDIDFEEVVTDFEAGVSSGVTVESTASLETYRDGRQARLRTAARDMADSGVDVIVVQPLVDEPIKGVFQRAGVRVLDYIETPRADIHRIARATGATVVDHIEDVTDDDLGHAGSFVERRVGENLLAVFDGCEGGVFTIQLGTGLASQTAEHERLVRSGIESTVRALRDEQVLPGGGASMMALSMALSDYVSSNRGKEQLAVEAAADSMDSLVRTLVRNAGQDPTLARTSLRRAHASAETTSAPLGFDLPVIEPVNTWDAGVVEPRRVLSQAIETAHAAVEPLLTVDTVVHPEVDWSEYTPEAENR